MYKVLLYFSFGIVTATKDKTPNGETILFNSLEDAENYGRSTGVIFETVEAKQ